MFARTTHPFCITCSCVVRVPPPPSRGQSVGRQFQSRPRVGIFSQRCWVSLTEMMRAVLSELWWPLPCHGHAHSYTAAHSTVTPCATDWASHGGEAHTRLPRLQPVGTHAHYVRVASAMHMPPPDVHHPSWPRDAHASPQQPAPLRLDSSRTNGRGKHCSQASAL